MNIKFENINTFFKGMSFDLEEREERKGTFQYGMNGTLYSDNGVLSYSSMKGTVVILDPAIETNEWATGIVKYLGGFAFKNQMVLIAKYNNAYSEDFIATQIKQYTVEDQLLGFNIGSAPTSLDLEAGLKEHIINSNAIDVQTATEQIDSSNEYLTNPNALFDINDYFELSNITPPNYEICLLTQDLIVPINNATYSDAIILITKNDDGTLTGDVVWNGYLNLDINRKINIVGIDENTSYKRVYFTDALNPLRSFNLKDKNLLFKRPGEFNVFKDFSLLQPKITKIKNQGSLTAGNVQYLYRLISDDGQVSPFSPMSKIINITDKSGNVDFKGGDINQTTNKSVEVKCDIINHELFQEIECIALEYGLKGEITQIKTLGIKTINEVVYFEHTGYEATYDQSLTIDDVLKNANNWTYCNDLAIKNNKLIAVGLRNKAYPYGINYLEDQFLLKGFNSSGASYDYLINPTPSTYKYIDPSNTEKYFSVSKTQFTKLMCFGSFTLTLQHTSIPANKISQTFISSKEYYIDYMQEVFDWLDAQDLTSLFPNLTVTLVNNTILFSRTTGTPDLSLYQLRSSSDQLILELENEYELDESSLSITTANLVPGAVSLGFNQGNGVRLSWQVQEDHLMTRSNELLNDDNIFNIQEPSLIKGFMKGETYRIGIQCFKSGTPLFVLPAGDITAPSIGDPILLINDQGDKATMPKSDDPQVYANQHIKEDKLYAQRLMLKTEVRFSCHMKSFIDSYQMVYVERTENNRTILAQGISGPLQRITNFENINKGEDRAPEVFRKWTLPYRGGPIHDGNGRLTYTTKGENYQETNNGSHDAALNRVINNNKLFYFDCPDLIYNNISDKLLEIGNVEVQGRLKTDHSRGYLEEQSIYKDTSLPWFTGGVTPDLRNWWDEYALRNPLDPMPQTFSKTITENADYPTSEIVEDQRENEDFVEKFVTDRPETNPYFINCSVFCDFSVYKSTHEIDISRKVNDGEILPGSIFNLSNEVSNNALTLGRPNWFYSNLWRNGLVRQGNPGAMWSHTANVSTGYSTVIIKTKDDVFTDLMLGQERINMICDEKHGNILYRNILNNFSSDAHALINIKLNNDENVYGGRTRYALSRNIYIPLGPIVPLYQDTNQSQINIIEGDTYVSLFMRAKNTFHNHAQFLAEFRRLKNTTNNRSYNANENNGNVEYEMNRGGAWLYAVVLETMVEERLSYDYRLYRNKAPLDFGRETNEYVNEAYFTTNNSKSYIPKPFNYKDEPLRMSSVNASKIKLSGDTYDSFGSFLINDFIELEKKYGDISNVLVHLNKLYVIQQKATNYIMMEPAETITTDSGSNVQIQSGSGKVFVDKEVISEYGTAIRRAVSLNPDFGFSFFDEIKNEFVKNGKPKGIEHMMQLKFMEHFENNPVIDAEGFFDPKYKSTMLNLKTLDNSFLTLSYNEVLQVFNPYNAYNNSLFINFDNRLFAPKLGDETFMHELNKGNYLNFFGIQHTMKLGYISNGGQKGSKIFSGITILTNLGYKIKSVNIHDNLDETDIRTITSDHTRYDINEGVHDIPLLNITDRAPKRGEWAYIELEIESINNKKIDINQITTHLRRSMI